MPFNSSLKVKEVTLYLLFMCMYMSLKVISLLKYLISNVHLISFINTSLQTPNFLNKILLIYEEKYGAEKILLLLEPN